MSSYKAKLCVNIFSVRVKIKLTCSSIASIASSVVFTRFSELAVMKMKSVCGSANKNSNSWRKFHLLSLICTSLSLLNVLFFLDATDQFYDSFNDVLTCPTCRATVSGGALMSSIISGCIMEIFVPLNSLWSNPAHCIFNHLHFVK